MLKADVWADVFAGPNGTECLPWATLVTDSIKNRTDSGGERLGQGSRDIFSFDEFSPRVQDVPRGVLGAVI